MNTSWLVERSQDKTRYEDINYAGFMVPERRPASTSELVQMVRHLSQNTMPSTNLFCAASVCGNALQPTAGALGDAAYFYIKNDNRYRLIPLSNSSSFVQGYQDSGAINRGVVPQLAGSTLKTRLTEERAGVTDGSKQLKKTCEVSIQTEDILGEEYHGDDENNQFHEDGWEYSCSGSSGISLDIDGYEDNNSNTSYDVEWDTSSIGSGILDESFYEGTSDEGSYSNDLKRDNNGDGQGENGDYNIDLVNSCFQPLNNDYYTINVISFEDQQDGEENNLRTVK